MNDRLVLCLLGNKSNPIHTTATCEPTFLTIHRFPILLLLINFGDCDPDLFCGGQILAHVSIYLGEEVKGQLSPWLYVQDMETCY